MTFSNSLLETWALVKRYNVNPASRSYHDIDAAIFPYLAHIGDKED